LFPTVDIGCNKGRMCVHGIVIVLVCVRPWHCV